MLSHHDFQGTPVDLHDTAHAMLAGSDADSVFVLGPAFAVVSALALLAVERGIAWWTARRAGRLPDPAEVPWFLRAS